MGSRGWIALALAVLLAGAALAWWWLRPAPRTVFFAEIRFEQGFEALSSEAAPSPTSLDDGFWFVEETRQLFPATGEPRGRGSLAVGVAWYRPDAHPPRQLRQTLVVSAGPAFRWSGAGTALRRQSDAFAALAEPPEAELQREDDACVLAVAGERLRVPIGESARSKARVRELGLDDAIERLRAAIPDLSEPDAELRTTIGLRLDPDGDERVEIHEGYAIDCHGEVELQPDDLLSRLRSARAALVAGDVTGARAELEALAAIAPRDPIVRNLARRVEAASEGVREALTGFVEVPAAAGRDLIAEVTVWPAGQAPETAVAQVPALGGRFRVLLPAGEYELQCRAPGHEPVRVRARVPQEGEVRCVLR